MIRDRDGDRAKVAETETGTMSEARSLQQRQKTKRRPSQ